MAAFTPGPWHRNIKPASKYPTVWAGRNTHVAYMATGLPADEIEANICLTTAAPELLAACETALDYLEHCDGYHHDDGHFLRAVIRKAKGDATKPMTESEMIDETRDRR